HDAAPALRVEVAARLLQLLFDRRVAGLVALAADVEAVEADAALDGELVHEACGRVAGRSRRAELVADAGPLALRVAEVTQVVRVLNDVLLVLEPGLAGHCFPQLDQLDEVGDVLGSRDVAWRKPDHG